MPCCTDAAQADAGPPMGRWFFLEHMPLDEIGPVGQIVATGAAMLPLDGPTVGVG